MLLPGVLIHKDRVALTYRWRCGPRSWTNAATQDWWALPLTLQRPSMIMNLAVGNTVMTARSEMRARRSLRL